MVSVEKTTLGKKAVVVLSGGQDSTTCLFWAKSNFEEVFAINFSYGQRHEEETKVAEKLCASLGIVFTHIDISNMFKISKSGLLDKSTNLSETGEKGLPNSFVPNRNQVFITLAHSLAQTLGCDSIVTGVCQTDYSGYPDCREVFIKRLEEVSNLGSMSNIRIHTPLMFLTKAKTFKLAEKLGCLDIIVNETLTCYEGSNTLNDWGKGCGECPACILRKEGYYEFIETNR